MRIGIDLDNTLADYRVPLERLCVRHGVPCQQSDPKLALRDALRLRGEESVWTAMQGEIYGPLMIEASLFSGAADALGALLSSGSSLVIVSHRTRYPLSGSGHDLHAFARKWIIANGLGHLEVFFEASRDEKVARIRNSGFDWFVDDLPEVLTHRDFPIGTRRILFDPGGNHPVAEGLASAGSWSEVFGHIIKSDE